MQKIKSEMRVSVDCFIKGLLSAELLTTEMPETISKAEAHSYLGLHVPPPCFPKKVADSGSGFKSRPK